MPLPLLVSRLQGFCNVNVYVKISPFPLTDHFSISEDSSVVTNKWEIPHTTMRMKRASILQSIVGD